MKTQSDLKTYLLLKLFLFQQKAIDFANEILSLKRLVLSRYMPQSAPIYREILKVRRRIQTISDVNEVYQIVCAVIAVRRIKGDIAEVGVYQGGTAKVIAEYKGEKSLYLFDTFEGFPKTGRHDIAFFRKGMCSSEYEEVKSFFKNYKGIYIYKGVFPQDTGKYIKNKRFSFVNLDVDLYESTLHCLQFFYDRMNRGGIIMSHDYSAIPGVYKAFNDFFEDKDEIIVNLTGSQCLVVKL